MGEEGQPMHTEDLALFSVPPVNVAEDKVMWVEHLPSFGMNGKASVQFHIPGTGNQYTDLSKTDLYVKVMIVDKKGNLFRQDGENAAIPIDNVLHSLWSMVDIKLNGTLVSTSGTNYMYKAFLENLLHYSYDARHYQMSMVGFTGDGGDFDQTDIDGLPISYGLKSRAAWWKKINTIYDLQTEGNPDNDSDEEWSDPNCVEFIGPLLADVCNQDRLILNGVDIDIKLWPNKDPFRLTTFPDGTEAYILLEEVKLNVCKVTVSSAAVLGIEDNLQHTPALYPLSRTDVRTFNIGKGSYGDVIEDMFQGEVPSRLVVGMVDAEAYAGDYQKNPFRFKPFNLASIGFYVDGEPTPRPPYQFDMKDCDYVEGLQSLYRIAGKLNENTDLGITRDTYRQGYALIGFEVDPTASAHFDYLGKPKSGRTRLTLRFHKPLKRPITVIVYATFPEVMQIDQCRIVCLREKERASSRLRGPGR
jgi:hypothetical protein